MSLAIQDGFYYATTQNEVQVLYHNNKYFLYYFVFDISLDLILYHIIKIVIYFFISWSFSPLERQTGWGAVIGGCIYWTCFNSVNQTMVQRYISLDSKKKAIT